MEYWNIHRHSLGSVLQFKRGTHVTGVKPIPSYLQVFVAWKFLTAEREMLDRAEASLQWSALYHCLLFKASTNLGKRLSQFTEKSFQWCWNTFRRKLLFFSNVDSCLLCQMAFLQIQCSKKKGKRYFSNEASMIRLLLTIPLLHQALCL